MKAPLSWILDHVDVPAGTTTEEITDRLTLTGLKLEAIVSPGRDITGPLVIGRVLTMEPEPQKNGKTINWCTVDVGDANGTGEPQGIVCGAHNFAPGDLVVTVLPGGVLPGGFEIGARKTYGHLSAGMICSARELGLGEDHDGIIVLPADAGEPGQDVRPVLGLDEEVIEFEVNPDRAYALSLRGIAREVLVSVDGRERLPRPGAARHPGGQRPGPPGRRRGRRGLPGLRGPARSTGFDPRAPDAGLHRPAHHRGRDAADLARRRRHQLRDARDRPPDPRLRRRQGCSGAIVVRRAREGERLTTLDGTDRTLDPGDLVVTDDSGIIGLGGVMGGETTEMSGTTTSVLVEAAHWDAVSMFRTGSPPQDHLRGRQAQRARRRPDDLRGRGRPCRRAARRARRRHGPPGRHRRRHPAGDAGRRGRRRPRRPRVRDADHRGAVASSACARSAARSTARARLSVTPPPWRPDLTDAQDFSEEVIRLVGYDKVPSVLPTPPSGRGLTRPQQLRRRIGRTLAGEGFVEVVTFPFVGEADLDALGPGGRRPAPRPAAAVQPAQRRGRLHDLDPAARACCARPARTSGTAPPTSRSSRPPPSRCPRHAGPAAILPVDRRPTEAEFEALDAALPAQPLHLALVAAG